MTDNTEILAATVAQLADTPPKLKKEREYTGVLVIAIVVLACIGLFVVFRGKKHGSK